MAVLTADDAAAEEKDTETGSLAFALLVPCRAAMHGRMALHGTYFQINEVFLCQDQQGGSLEA